MRNDKFGQQILDENDLCHAYLSDPDAVITQALVNQHIQLNEILDLKNTPNASLYIEPSCSIEEFEKMMQIIASEGIDPFMSGKLRDPEKIQDNEALLRGKRCA